MIKNSTKNHALKEIVLGLSIFVACTLFLISGAVTPKDSGAQSGLPNLTGAAWSDNIGWICLDSSCGGLVEPAVVIQANGNIEGYGWSDNIGWVKFGNLSGYPSGSGTVAANAKYDSATKAITGWARACAGTVNGDCSSMTSRTDGWDGWISLKGTNYGLRVSADRTVVESVTGIGDPYAWGSDVVGWVNFKDVGVEGLSNDCNYNGTNIANGGELVINGSCDVDGNRTITTVTCENGNTTENEDIQPCPEASCTLPPLAGQTVGLPLAADVFPVTRYSRLQVRVNMETGESCDSYMTKFTCTSQPGGEGQPPVGLLVATPPIPQGANVNDYKYEDCRALPNIIER